ncbi:MAG: hypothetical protein ACC618_02675 [Patescibacteria group bacterium]
MPLPKEIIGYVKNLRGKRGNDYRKLPYLEKGSLKGMCMSSMQVADQFRGQHWRSNEARGHSDQKRGHSVAVIPTRGQSGVIVDFTNPEAVIIGSVKNMDDARTVAPKLEECTGYSGWYNRDEVDSQYHK